MVLWLRYAALQNLIPSFPGLCPPPSTLAQSKERKGSNFAIWQPCVKDSETIYKLKMAANELSKPRRGPAAASVDMEVILEQFTSEIT